MTLSLLAVALSKVLGAFRDLAAAREDLSGKA
jgi:hypothetical protein